MCYKEQVLVSQGIYGQVSGICERRGRERGREGEGEGKGGRGRRRRKTQRGLRKELDIGCIGYKKERKKKETN